MVANFEKTNNQCVNFYNSKLYNYDSLNYRSLAEVAIAKAIDKYNSNQDPDETYHHLIYLPNNIIVTGQERKPGSTMKIESDFLLNIHAYGFGVLEVDGSQHDNDDQMEKDWHKEKIWKGMGIKVIERFSASECLEDPDDVIDRFITRLHLVYCKFYVDDKESSIAALKWDSLYRLLKIIRKLDDFENMQYSLIPLSFDGYTFILGISDLAHIQEDLLIKRLNAAAYKAFKLTFTFKIVKISSGICHLIRSEIDEVIETIIENESKQQKDN
jgi:hypothetical protein